MNKKKETEEERRKRKQYRRIFNKAALNSLFTLKPEDFEDQAEESEDKEE
jgi:hypothetical protein